MSESELFFAELVKMNWSLRVPGDSIGNLRMASEIPSTFLNDPFKAVDFTGLLATAAFHFYSSPITTPGSECPMFCLQDCCLSIFPGMSSERVTG